MRMSHNMQTVTSNQFWLILAKSKNNGKFDLECYNSPLEM